MLGGRLLVAAVVVAAVESSAGSTLGVLVVVLSVLLELLLGGLARGLLPVGLLESLSDPGGESLALGDAEFGRGIG